MRFMHRVLATINKLYIASYLNPLINLNFINSLHFFSTNHTSLIQTLIQEPNSKIKSILDSHQNSTFKSPDFSWHALVSSLNSSSLSKGILALEWRLEKMVKDKERDQEQYSELISLCGETRDLLLAIRVFVTMESLGVKPTSDTFNSLIWVSLSLRNEMTALSLFEIMDRSHDFKPNSNTFNAFISIYSKLGNIKAMQAWASAKLAAGFPADLQFYESLISGCVKVQSYEGADRYYEEMISLGIIPSLYILERMVDGLCDQKNIGRAKEFIWYILNNGWKINVHIAHRLVGLYSALGKIENIEDLLQILMESNQSSQVLSRVCCGIIHMHAKADRLDDVEHTVGRMLEQGIPFYSAEDVNGIISSYFRRSAFDRLELFLKHIKSSYHFSKSTRDLLIFNYHKAGLLERLDGLLNELS